ncbi:pyridoxal phosphate-dependent decarboxylase family protein [Ilumatobacter sp.]|uniref:pyridoxal phosphate-dependent decarboxylase family protein n=1 Tax=Ilumatobacter sp. TaxID=1967498 RepID=UPI003752845C
MIETKTTDELVAGIAARATAHLANPPRGHDLVINFASPRELIDTFDTTVGLAFAEAASAEHDDAVLAAVDLVIKHSMHTSHPRFVNQNFAGPDPISVVGDWLGSALNTTGATFEVAPVFTLMESAVLHKLGRFAGYVEAGSNPIPSLPPGMFCPGGSVGTLFALQLARHRHQPDIAQRGSNGDRLAIFVSEAGHYAATKSAALLGIGSDHVVKVDADYEGCIDPAALTAAIDAAISAGAIPLAVIGTAGTTVTSAFDDLDAVADVCEQHGVWLHVDGCYGGSALFSAAHAHRLAGVERSDSFVWNLHKMMGMTQQCTALLVKRPEQLAACFAGHADYLFQPDKQFAEYDSGDRTFQCARRIDVLKLWLAWKAHGDVGFAARIDHAMAMADYTRQHIAESDGAFVPVVSGSFTNVVFAWVPPELRPLGSIDNLGDGVRNRLHGLPPKIKAQMQSHGTGMIGFQPIHGINTFRMICMSTTLQPDDIDALLDAIDRYGNAVS